jgi:hypothetical protein
VRWREETAVLQIGNARPPHVVECDLALAPPATLAHMPPLTETEEDTIGSQLK